MTAKPSTAQLRRWFILLYSLSQTIRSSNFEMMPQKAATSCSYRTLRLQHSGARGDLGFSSPVASHTLRVGSVGWLLVLQTPERREASFPMMRFPVPGPALGWFLRLRLGRHVLRRRHFDGVTRDAASRQTDSELKGRWTDPPAEKCQFVGCRRVGIKACWCFAVSICGS